ncbi:hypothetical protein SAMN05421644_12119 [Allochromatium warmingii]|uniref:ATP-binding protein n=1 Tax=Allochromatium warmingii TaxID=61595 RepID=A0A1H3FVR1_ALLWA|nr:ATP-binding protein [Allochromatium warmingii]SDX95183.1 hypothetical protein SAMN05421644_12119 [Allochromatium warmingii]
MNASLADVLVHIDQNLSAEQRAQVEASLRQIEGVVSVANHDERPHLTLIAYRPDLTTSAALLACVKAAGVSAELVGL